MDREMQKTFKPAFLSPNGQQEVIFFSLTKRSLIEKRPVNTFALNVIIFSGSFRS